VRLNEPLIDTLNQYRLDIQAHFSENLDAYRFVNEPYESTISGQHKLFTAQATHVAWMIEQAKEFSDESKAMRWLCFIQGWMWSRNLLTIDKAIEHNRAILNPSNV